MFWKTPLRRRSRGGRSGPVPLPEVLQRTKFTSESSRKVASWTPQHKQASGGESYFDVCAAPGSRAGNDKLAEGGGGRERAERAGSSLPDLPDPGERRSVPTRGRRSGLKCRNSCCYYAGFLECAGASDQILAFKKTQHASPALGLS